MASIQGSSSALPLLPVLTQDGQQADEYDGEGAHAEPEDVLLLEQLAVGPRVARLAEAAVPLGRLPVDALAPVAAGVVQALVAVHAALPVGGHALAARAAFYSSGGRVSLYTVL